MKKTLFAAVLAAVTVSAGAAPFAMVTDLKGGATSEQGKLALLSYIEKPTQVRVEPGGKLVVTYFANGTQYSFSGPARVSLEAATPKVIEGAQSEARKVGPEKTISGGGLSADQWRRLQQATVVMRTVRSSFTVVGPDRTALLDRQPEFEWTALPAAKAYRLVVYGPDNSVIHEMRTEKNSARPGSALTLEPGKRYRWKVDALGVQKPQTTSGTFTVADDSARRELLAARPGGGDTAARAFYATQLEMQGHAHDARAEWKALAREFPNEPEFAERAK
jgi:hypothetical protein